MAEVKQVPGREDSSFNFCISYYGMPVFVKNKASLYEVNKMNEIQGLAAESSHGLGFRTPKILRDVDTTELPDVVFERQPKEGHVLVTEYFGEEDFPDLYTLIKEAIANNDPSSVADLTHVWPRIVEGMAFLHQHNVQHLDLHWKHVLVNRQNPEDVVIFDWGGPEEIPEMPEEKDILSLINIEAELYAVGLINEPHMAYMEEFRELFLEQYRFCIEEHYLFKKAELAPLPNLETLPSGDVEASNLTRLGKGNNRELERYATLLGAKEVGHLSPKNWIEQVTGMSDYVYMRFDPNLPINVQRVAESFQGDVPDKVIVNVEESMIVVDAALMKLMSAALSHLQLYNAVPEIASSEQVSVV